MNAVEAQDFKHLLLQDTEYRALAEQHHQLEHRLHQLTDRHYLSQQEQLEEVTLKKQKLVLKDRMEAMTREYQQARSRAS